MTSAPRDCWMPLRVYAREARLLVDWCDMGDARFSDPFFSQTVEKRLQDPYALLFRRQTGIDEVLALAERDPGVPPAGFVFHMSRCGSTLVSQMHAQLDESIVLSEPTPLETLLHLRLFSRGIPDEQWIAWLRALLGVMARPRRGVERRVIVKFDAWPVLALPLIRAAFPDVPWIFLHRDPVEVMVSHQRQTGATMVPGPFPPGLFGVAPQELATLAPEEYQARVLAALCDAASAELHHGGMAVAYETLPDAVGTSIAAHFGLVHDDRDLQRMRRVAGLDAKRPHRAFVADSAEKRQAASAALREAAERWALPAWRRLRAMHTDAALAAAGV